MNWLFPSILYAALRQSLRIYTSSDAVPLQDENILIDRVIEEFAKIESVLYFPITTTEVYTGTLVLQRHFTPHGAIVEIIQCNEKHPFSWAG